MSRAEIDVLIPVHNAAPTLDASLTSITSQTAYGIRIIIVDDGSTDTTPGRLAAWAAREPRIKVISIAKSGIVTALNVGLPHCTAAYIARFDADDIAFPNRLARQRAYLDANPAHVAVGCRVEHIDEDGMPVLGLPQPGSPNAADASWAPAREPYIIHPFLMVRRNAILQVGGYRHVPLSEDSDLYWRLEEIGKLHNCEEALGQYRMHLRSVSSASIESGRLMAIGSQLGAISALRRRARKTDLEFAPEWRTALLSAVTLHAMSANAETQLRPDEISRFRLAVAMKLLELAAYRSYEVDMSDCAFVRAALAHVGLFYPENRNHIRWHITETARRLLRAGEFAKARALTPPGLYARVAAKSLRPAGSKFTGSRT